MAESSEIQWTGGTFNPVRGCTKVSPGCLNCYAAREAVRFPHVRGIWGDKGTRILAIPSAWKEPLTWNRKARDSNTRMMVFCASLADVFEEWQGDLHYPAPGNEGLERAYYTGKELMRPSTVKAVTLIKHRPATMSDMRAQLFELIEHTPWLDWQLLTKRPENVMGMVPAHWAKAFPDNVWMGTTVEDATRMNRIPILRAIPAVRRFLSCEPLLEDLGRMNLTGIHWVIAGGESGPNARPMHPQWAASIRAQCQLAGVPFFFKQWGEYVPANTLEDLSPDTPRFMGDHREFADCGGMVHVGKKAAGRTLDGHEWDQFPAPLDK